MNMHPVVPSFKLGKLVNLFSPEFSLTVGRRNDLMERALGGMSIANRFGTSGKSQGARSKPNLRGSRIP